MVIGKTDGEAVAGRAVGGHFFLSTVGTWFVKFARGVRDLS